VLVLSCLPCADVDFTFKEKKLSIDKAFNQQSNNIEDHCSPFCNCSCCAGFSINHFVSAIATVSFFSNDLISSFLPSEITGVALPVWQPPQLV